jgi:hypothetical protein
MIRSLQLSVPVRVLGTVLVLVSAATPRLAQAGSWQPVGKMTQTRLGARATLLADGTVLVTGGLSASAERFDPKTNTFAAVGSMARSRDASHAAVRLKDGRVLVVGGGLSKLAEVFDPVTGTFTAIGNMLHARGGVTGTRLADGRVLLVGGWDGSKGPQAEAELFDPVTNTFQATGKTSVARYWHAAVGLPDNRVVILGGYDPQNVAVGAVEIYDPKPGTFIQAGTLAQSRGELAATLLPDGRILVVGGNHKDGPHDMLLASVEIYDPATGQSTLVDRFADPRVVPAVVNLTDGHVLVAGGLRDPKLAEQNLLRTADLIDPASGKIMPTNPMTEPRAGSAGVLLPDGRALVLGGQGWQGQRSIRLDTAEVYVP